MKNTKLTNTEKELIQAAQQTAKAYGREVDVSTLAAQLDRRPAAIENYLKHLAKNSEKELAKSVTLTELVQQLQQEAKKNMAKITALAKENAQLKAEEEAKRKAAEEAAKDLFVTETEGGNKGVTVMTPGAAAQGDESAQRSKNSVSTRLTRGNLYSPKTGKPLHE